MLLTRVVTGQGAQTPDSVLDPAIGEGEGFEVGLVARKQEAPLAGFGILKCRQYLLQMFPDLVGMRDPLRCLD